jgi:hypothetical protein
MLKRVLDRNPFHSVPSATAKSFCSSGFLKATFFASWLERRKNELDHSSFLRYSGIVRSFLEFLGEKAQDDLSTLCSADIRRFRDYQAGRMSATSAAVCFASRLNSIRSSQQDPVSLRQ